MDSLITAAARALAAGDPHGAWKRVALRDDAPRLPSENSHGFFQVSAQDCCSDALAHGPMRLQREV
jgi:hypothetical protein